MQLYGDGVTRNFLTILETDTRRAAKSLLRLAIVSPLVFLLAWLALSNFDSWGVLSVPVLFLAAFISAWLYTRHFVLESYEVSLRDHWNRWMRWSVSCKTVRECYAKVHDRPTGPSWWIAGLLLSGVILFHAVLGVLALNETAGLAIVLPIFALDATLLGLMIGRRYAERRWYHKFLRSCNELLRDGSLGLWGVY